MSASHDICGRNDGWIFRPVAVGPVNLGVVRIVVFATIALSVNVGNLAWFATLPRDLIFPPAGTGWLVEFLSASSSQGRWKGCPKTRPCGSIAWSSRRRRPRRATSSWWVVS